jgi:hypothetical protein
VRPQAIGDLLPERWQMAGVLPGGFIRRDRLAPEPQIIDAVAE